jgi:hypothetical protein
MTLRPGTGQKRASIQTVGSPAYIDLSEKNRQTGHSHECTLHSTPELSPTRTLHPFWGNFRVAGHTTRIRIRPGCKRFCKKSPGFVV